MKGQDIPGVHQIESMDAESWLDLYRRVVAPRFNALYAQFLPLGLGFQGFRAFGLIDSQWHGADHWARVACLGVAIADAMDSPSKNVAKDAGRTGASAHPGQLDADGLSPNERIEAVLLAAFFHDCGRIDEGRDSGHAMRGQQVFDAYAVAVGVDPRIARAASTAILAHATGPAIHPGAGPVTACLANADRLDRFRIGDVPDPRLLYPDKISAGLIPAARVLWRTIPDRLGRRPPPW